MDKILSYLSPFSWVKTTGTCSWQIIPTQCQVQECVELHFHSPIRFYNLYRNTSPLTVIILFLTWLPYVTRRYGVMPACQMYVTCTWVCFPLMESETRKECGHSATSLMNYTEAFELLRVTSCSSKQWKINRSKWKGSKFLVRVQQGQSCSLQRTIQNVHRARPAAMLAA